MSFAVILPAAGLSSRFGAQRNKLMEMLAGRTILRRAVDAFLCRADVAQVVIATRSPDLIASALAELTADQRIQLVAGGAHRAASVRNALAAVDPSAEWVAVHDAARPLPGQELITRTLEAAQRYGAAVPALPVALTIKQATGPLPAAVEQTVPRQNLWAMQTPQIMRRKDLERAFATCPIPLDQVTDDVQLIELAGGAVWLVPGDERNLKITTELDLKVAQMLLAHPEG